MNEKERLDALIEAILQNAPESFDSDAAPDEIAVQYVRWLESRQRSHRDREPVQ